MDWLQLVLQGLLGAPYWCCMETGHNRFFNTVDCRLNIYNVLFFRVEDRNDPLVQKIRRYISVFSKDGDQARDKKEPEKIDTSTDPMAGEILAKPIRRGGADTNRKSLRGWQKIRQSTLGFDTEKDERQFDGQDIQFV